MRISTLPLSLVVLASAGCAAAAGAFPVGRSADVVVVDENARGERGPRRPGNVPPGHYPPPGECRIWHPGTPPGQQPPPAKCEALIGRVPRGAFLLYNREAWDSRYDWREHARRNPGSVPDLVLRVMGSR